jgi:hypothetical protein
MELKNKLRNIFNENLEKAVKSSTLKCPKCENSLGHIGDCKPSSIVENNSSELEIGAKHEKEEHGLSDEMAMKIASDHLREHPNYYSKMAKCGLDEELSTDTSTPNIPPQSQNNDQGKDPSQIDPNTYKKYKAEADNVNKKIDNFTTQLQSLKQQKMDLAKKYGINPNY